MIDLDVRYSKKLKTEGLAADYILSLKRSIGFLSCDEAPFIGTAFWVSKTMVMTAGHCFILKKNAPTDVSNLNSASKNILFHKFDGKGKIALTIYYIDVNKDVALLTCIGDNDMVPILLSANIPTNLMSIILVSAELTVASQHDQKVPQFHTAIGSVTQVLDEVADNVKFFYQAITSGGMSGAPIILNEGALIGVGMHTESTNEDGVKYPGNFPTAISSHTLAAVFANATK